MTVYWAGLATWFGSAMFLVIATPIVFRVIREQDPTLPTVLSVNLDAQHATLLASTIVGKLMQSVTRVGLACAIAVLVGLAGQAFVLPMRSGQTLLQMLIRVALFFAATGALAYDWRVLSPRLFHWRQEYIDHADEPDVANAAKDHLDHASRESINVLFGMIVLLLGLILFSANVSYFSFGGG